MAQVFEPPSALPLRDRKLTATNILLGTDFSRASDLALNYALALARRGDAQIYLAHVVAAASSPGPTGFQNTTDAPWHAAERGMAELLVSGRLRGIPHEVLLERGAVWPTLAKLIRKHEIDLVVTGSHRHAPSSPATIGAVASEVLERAECAVLTVGPKVAQDENAGEPLLRNVLFATDFGAAAEQTAAFAVSLAREHGSRLTLLHVIEENRERQPLAVAQAHHGSNDKPLGDVTLPLTEGWHKTECRVSSSTVVREILAHARETKADLLVMNAESRKAPVATSASVPFRVIMKAHCPVLTVRQPLAPA